MELITPDFTELGWPNPAESAALWNGLVVEAALLELAASQARPAIRAALAQFLGPPPDLRQTDLTRPCLN